MSQIRKNSLKATTWIYLGFAIGAVNTYFLTHKLWFSTDENGLARAMLEIGLMIYGFSTLGSNALLYKFFPYYQDNLKPKENDILGLAFIISLIGFALTFTGIYFLEDVIHRKFSTNSRLLVEYFYWTIPLGFFILMYYVLESYSYGFNKGVLATLLKETVIRLFTLIIITLKILQIIDFDTFIKLFSLQYALIFFILTFLLIKDKILWIQFRPSKVTIKFRKKIASMLMLTAIAFMVSVLRQTIDGLVLAAKQNLTQVGIFGLAAYMVSVLQAPFRSIIAVTIPLLSRAWKEKDYTEINRIYQRSSINLLSFSLFAFLLIWLNYSSAIELLNINPVYQDGKWVFFILGIVTIIEMGTGVNAQIIGTSNYWRFELWTSLLLTALIIPLSYTLTVKYGIFGPAFANLISFSIYNGIRYLFLLKKFDMQPFTQKTAEVIGIAAIAYIISFLSFKNFSPIIKMTGSSLVFSVIYLSMIAYRQITPDLEPVFKNIVSRVKILKKK
jgi:O-antigen/teichoic acid export membrane protein